MSYLHFPANQEPACPMCFVAMPFGKKAPPGMDEPVIDFDVIYSHIEQVVEAEQLACYRADFEPGGGFIHRSMYERLLVAEYVVADLTFANPNVTYEVGVRHGASARPTILIGAVDLMGFLPFDFRPLRVLPYQLAQDGALGEQQAGALRQGLRQRLRDAIAGILPTDNPILQVTSWKPMGRIEHDKTDVFLERLRFVGSIGERIRSALRLADRDASVAELAALQEELLAGPEVVAQLHSALLGIYLGYRERKAYQKMIDLFPRLPDELRATPVAQEQCALALNRLAEIAAEAAATDGEGAGEAQRDRATELRRQALGVLDAMPPAAVTSETWGIRGRIYKGWYDAETRAGHEPEANAMLGRAIGAYEKGLRADLRDYYPGVNAVTLRLRRGQAEDLSALDSLLPVVRLAVACAPEAESEEERYWQIATRLELASAARDWEAARDESTRLLGIDAADWMRETTVGNLEIQKQAYRADARAVEEIDGLVARLTPSVGG